MSSAALPALKRGPRPSTSREEIVECAIRLLDRHGPETLTLRGVARELGVAMGALYRYFKNLADLEDEVAAKIMSQMRQLDASAKEDLREQLVLLGMDMFAMHRRYPYLLKIEGPATARVAARHTRSFLSTLMDAGVAFEAAIALYSTLGSLAYSWGTQSRPAGDPDLQQEIGQAFVGELGDLAGAFLRLATEVPDGKVFRRWFLLHIDAFLLQQQKARRSR